ncbi:MAG: HAMP domain-containing protein [Acidobacteria bacterium]|nr:HAMP domain-containing protein [Acidobacteriota bacterium]
MTAALLLVLEGLILLILGVDLSLGFLLVSTPVRLTLTAAAAGVLALAVLRTPRIPRTARSPLLVLGAAGLIVGTLGGLEIRAVRLLQRGWEAGASDRLEARARLLEQDFGHFLEGLVRPIDPAGAPVGDRSDAFGALHEAQGRSRLPPERLGFSIYGADGSLLAWQGNSAGPPQDLMSFPCPGPSFGTAGDAATRRLYAVTCSPAGVRWVVEFALDPAPRTLARDPSSTGLAFLPHWQEAGPAAVRLREDRGGQDDLAELFARQGDRHWGRRGSESGTTLAFPLRAPSGERLAIVTLRDRWASQEIGAHRRLFRILGGLVLAAAMFLAWILPLRKDGIRSRTGRALMASAAVWTVRSALLALAEPSGLTRLPVYEISDQASPLLALVRSPADFLLTAIACCAQAFILLLALEDVGRRVPSRRPRLVRAFALASGILVFAGTVLALHRFLDRLVQDARLDLSRIEIGELASPRLALQAGLFLFALAAGLLLRALVDVILRHGARADDWPWLRWLRGAGASGVPRILRAAGAILALTLGYASLLHHSYDRLRRDVFEDDLRPLVLEQKALRRRALRASMSLARDPDFGALAALASEGRAGSGAAYRLWLATPIADQGLASSVRIFDADGEARGGFAVDFAPTLDVSFEEAVAAARGDLVTLPPRAGTTVRKPVIFGSRWVGGARHPLLVVLTVSDDYDNLPMVGGRTVGAWLFRAGTPPRGNPELLRSDPLMAVFSNDLRRLYESGGEIPPPPLPARGALERAGRAWAIDQLRGGEAFILYFKGPQEVFALAHLHPGRTALLASYLRVFLLNAFLALLGAGIAQAIRRSAWLRMPRPAPAATYSGRLVAVFLLAGLLPLLTLAYFTARSTTLGIDRDIATSGLASLQAARRVAEDYFTVTRPEEGGSLDDDVVYWLSRVVRQDINIYVGADLLSTSTRELYSSGLLNERLNGETYRAIYLEGKPFSLAEDRTVGLDYLTVSAPMRIDRQGTMGLISIPLLEHRYAAARKEEDVRDAALIVTCFAVLLLALVGHVLAVRVSRPITLLVGAARRVAVGDLDARVDVTASDETALLVEAFNGMAASLRQQRQDLRRHADYIEKVLKSATTGVVSIDSAGTIITVNPAAQALLAGGGGGPVAGDDLHRHLEGDPALAPLLSALRRALARGVEREVEIVFAGRRQSTQAGVPAEGPRRVRAVFIPFAPEEDRPPGLIVLLEDVTEIVRSGRLAAWAEMARRVAHEIKNPLTPILLSVEHVRRVFKARDARFEKILEECLDNIRKQVEVLRQIALEFSIHARLPHLQPEPCPVGTLLDEALGPYAAAAPDGIRIRRDVPPGLPSVLVDRAIMVRALVNLIENALQAMPRGGALVVSARPADGPSGEARVVIEVRDSGCGIPEALKPRLFEPYFSTKSGGTGLGLGLARRVLEEHGGTIEVRSREGSGTVVILALPAAPAGAAPGVEP